MFSRKLTKALLETIEAGQKAVLMLNQRGFASFLLYANAIRARMPVVFDVSYLSREGSTLVCHREAVPPGVPQMRKPLPQEVRYGTQRVEPNLQACSRDGRPYRAHGCRYDVGRRGASAPA